MMSQGRPTLPSGRETTESSPSPIANRGDDPVNGRDPASEATTEALPAEMISSGNDLSGNDLYRCIVESANQGIWTIDGEQRTTFINAKLAETLGYRPEEVVGRPAWDLAFPEDQAEGDQRWASRKRGEEDQSEFRLRRKDGGEVWFHAATSPLLDSDGRFVGALGFFADITERRRADEALRESERQARQLADTMPHIVWTADRDGAVDYFNGRWYEYTGHVARGDPLGDGLAVGGPPRRPGAAARACATRRSRKARSSRPTSGCAIAGGPTDGTWSARCRCCDDAGRVLRRFGTATDIDDRRRAEEALRASEQRFRFLAESIPHLVWTCRPDGFVDYASPRSAGVPRRRPGGAAGLRLDRGDPPRGSRAHASRPGSGRSARGPSTTSSTASAAARRGIPMVPRARPAPARRRRPARGLVRHLHRHRRAVAEPAGDRPAQPRPPGAGRRAGDPLRDDPDRHRHRRGRRVRPDPGEPGARAAAGDRAGIEHLADRAGRASGRSTSASAATGGRSPRGAADAGRGPEGRPVIGDEPWRSVFADGRTKRIYGNAAPLFDEDGRPRGSVGAFMDMTEWRRVEAALADSEEQLRLAVEATGLGLFDRDLTTDDPAMVGSLQGDLRARAR